MLTTLVASALIASLQDMPFLSPAFGSHMVLQRDRPNTFWGWAAPGSPVTVTIGSRKASGKADPSGKWAVRISPPPVGGPYTVAVDGPSHVQLDDVLVGDVWICSGQSNMEMGIGMVNNAQEEIAKANYPGIRLFLVGRNTAMTPQPLMNGAWSVCSPATIAQGGWNGFSAAGYFFGRELHQRLHVPIGLVETSWGGTVAEAWTSRNGLIPFQEFAPALKTLDDYAKPGTPTMAQRLDSWFRANDPGSKDDAWTKADFDDSGWKTTSSPIFEAMGLNSFDGVVWYRKEVDLGQDGSGGALLQLGNVDDIDSTWVNGVKVGDTYAYLNWRQYRVPESVLKPGRNVIVVRALDTGGQGGLTTPANILWYIGGKEVHVTGDWRYAVGADLHQSPPLPPIAEGDPNVPTVLYNGMIAPVAPLAIKGAIWYQGESNAGRAAQYQNLLPAMINDWRRTWKQGDFPFFVVQLANFQVRHADPVDDAWAELREAQAIAVKKTRNTGLALAIDIGDRNDIHPKDKQTVGLRLALAALKVAYGQTLPYSGPAYKSVRREGNALRISFEHTEYGLKFTGGRLAGFAVAGADHKFYWADARIDGDTVVVSSANVAQPVAVRYAWDADPEATLYNGAGLPAVPFRAEIRR